MDIIKIKNNNIKKILYYFLILLLVFLILSAPAISAKADTVTNTAISEMCSVIASGMASSAVVASYGGIMAVVTAPMIEAAIVIFAAVGIGVAVGVLVKMFTSEDFCLNFGNSFWQFCKDNWDETNCVLTCSVASLNIWGTKLKTWLGVITDSDIDYTFDHDKYDIFPDTAFWNNQNKEIGYCDYEYKVVSKDNKDLIVYSHADSNEQFKLTVYGSNETYYISGFCNACWADCVILKPFTVNDSALYFPYCRTERGVSQQAPASVWLYYSFNGNGLKPYTVKGHSYLGFINSNNEVEYITTLQPDGTYHFQDFWINELMYDIVMKNASVLTVVDLPTEDTKNDDDVINFGNVTGSIGKDVITKGAYADEIEYNAGSDLIKGVSATNDEALVSISASDSSIPYTDDKTIATDLVNVTDISAVDTDEVTIDSSTAFSLGVTYLKMCGQQVGDKFPFAMVKDIKRMLSSFTFDEKNPVWDIPFKIPRLNIDNNMRIDLTPFHSLSNVSHVLFVAIVCVGLAFSTKKLFY